MELVISAVAGDLVNRFMSFLINKYRSEENIEDKTERLKDILIRVHMIVEEADGRYITNSMMLLQLKKLVGVMYRGYHVLDTIKYSTLHSSRAQQEVSSFSGMSFYNSINFLRTTKSTYISHEIQSILETLETNVSNMAEFVLLLGACDRVSRSPYDSYLYIDNFMFGRHVEKQQVINILMQENISPLSPTVIPIIGGTRVGKKTLIAHVCDNEKVRSKFPSILQINGENISRIEHGHFISGSRSLLVVELHSDVDDENWLKFYSSAKQMGRGSKIVIISRITKISRFGTVKPIHLYSLSHEEYSYLFKVLAFGSTNPEEQPQLASIAKDLAAALGGTLVVANVCADMLRKNQNVHFWLNILKRYQNVVKNNFSVFGEHPKNLMEKGHPVDITRFVSSSSSSQSSPTLRLMPPHLNEQHDSKKELPKVMFGDLIAGSAILPKEEFEMVTWESRLPPYRRFVNLATYCVDEKISQHHTASSSNKRQRFDM
ncbi:hypothetical protein ACP70R_019784 [Stipagrostis hirtigluma subsp. patula]